MSRHFASPTEPWFRIGRLEVSTVVLACLIAVASGIAWVVAPGLASALYFNSQLVAAGEVWRIVTWPLANDLWVVITALVLWYFGSDIERLIGRTRMAWLLVGTWAALTAASTVVELLPALRGAAAHLLRQRCRINARRVERLENVVAGGREKARLG